MSPATEVENFSLTFLDLEREKKKKVILLEGYLRASSILKIP